MNLKATRPRDDVIVVVLSAPSGMPMIVVTVTATASKAPAVIVIIVSRATSETTSTVGLVIVLIHFHTSQRTLELICELIGFSEGRADVPRFGVSFRDRLSQKLIDFSEGVLELSDILSHSKIVVEGLDVSFDTSGEGRDDVRVLLRNVGPRKMMLDLISEMMRCDVQGMGQLTRISVSTLILMIG